MLSFLRAGGGGDDATSSPPPPLEGGPQRTPLLVPQLLDSASRWHASTPVVSLLSDGTTLVRTWFEVRERAARFARVLRSPSSLGVRRGDRVATLALNSSAHLEVLYAVAGCGAVHHTLNPRLFEGDIAWIADDAGDVVVLFDGDLAPLAARLRRRLPKVRHWIALTPDKDGIVPLEYDSVDDEERGQIGGSGENGDDGRSGKRRKGRWLSYERLIETAPLPRSRLTAPSPWTPVPEDAPCALCYTSGTTGRPKGVLYSHRSNVLHALSASHGDALDVRATSTVLMAVPIFHANGWGLAHACPMAGASLVLPGRHLSGKDMASATRRFGVTQIAGVPTVFLDLVAAVRAERSGAERSGEEKTKGPTRGPGTPGAGGSRRPLPTLVSCVVGGAACPPSLASALRDDAGVLRVDHVYGMTELSPIGTVAGPTRQTRDKLSPEEQLLLGSKQGRPSLLVDMKIVGVGDGGSRVELPRDGKTPGELMVRGPHVIHRYANAPEPTVSEPPFPRSERNGSKRRGDGGVGDGYRELWFATGDLATIDEFGFMRIVDRTKDVIKSGGEFISSPHLEAEASSHPLVKQAAAIGLPDAKWGERPLLVVEVADGLGAEGGGKLTEEELKAFLKGKVASWWIPERVVFAPIPLGATGKVDKKVLRERYVGDGGGGGGGGKAPSPVSKL